MGRNNADFHQGNEGYSYTAFTAPDEDSNHIVHANFQGKRVGFLKWYAGHGEITDLEVLPEHRRKGVATQLWNQARAHSFANGLIPPEHSSARTSQGSAWASSLGEKVSPASASVPYIRRSKKEFMKMSEDHNG
jgi:GNAT superfamily N-acetyltransferase